VLRVGRIADAVLGETTFRRPPEFDLAAFWADWCAEVEEHRSNYRATVRVAPQLVPWLPYYFGAQVRDQMTGADPPDREGWILLTVSFESLEEARDRLLALGGAVEVLAPRALRATVADYAAQTVALYTRI